MVVDVRDVITCAKFEIVKPSWVTILQGEFSIFLLIFAWALQQCSANALPVILRQIKLQTLAATPVEIPGFKLAYGPHIHCQHYIVNFA